jgi:hypothetical protein
MVPPSITGTTYRITTDSTDSTTFWIGFQIAPAALEFAEQHHLSAL